MKKGRQRTKIALSSEQTTRNVDVLHFKDMSISNGFSWATHVYRLRYINVPTVAQIESGNATLAYRDDVVRKIYKVFKSKEGNGGLSSLSSGVYSYFKYLDSINHIGDPFTKAVMTQCIKHYNALSEDGREVSKADGIRQSLSYLLKSWGLSSVAQGLPSAYDYKANRSSAQKAFHAKKELKPIAKVLTRSALDFSKHIKSGTQPDFHPLYDEKLFMARVEQNGWNKVKASAQRHGFKACFIPPMSGSFRKGSNLTRELHSKYLFFNHATRNWFFVFSMLTGMNKTPLAEIKRSHVHFKDIGGGRYVFDGFKSRAGNKEIDNALGFSKRTKGLIENWLEVSKLMCQELGFEVNGDMPLLPYFGIDGIIKTFSHNGTKLHTINKQLEKIVGITVTTTRFRKTKSDVLMRVTEDVFVVSSGLNNSIAVVKKAYSDGVKEDHETNLSATLEAKTLIAKGNDVKESIENAKVLKGDILTDYDYKQLRKKEGKTSMVTPSGLHCSGSTPEQLITESKKMKQLGVDLLDDTGRCTDFLNCFDCSSHRLIASETEIWLMMSFLEQILALKEIITGNSAPKDEYFIVEQLLKRTLERLQNKAPDMYAKSKAKIDSGVYHPLYQDRSSLLQFF